MKKEKETKNQPNIIFIFTDQHRLSALGAYGETPCKTPNIDKLAKEGVLFKNTYTTCPVCSPARASIMTGKYPHAHGISTNIHELGCSVHELEDNPELLSRRLEQAGYNLGYTGKWHLGTNNETTRFGTANKPSLPKDVGFEGQNFPGHGGGGFAYPEYKQYLKENGFEHKVKDWSEKTKLIWPAGELEGPEESTVPYFLAGNTINMMDDFSGSDKPFFIWHNFWGPHGPFYVTKEYLDIYRDIEIPEWPNYSWPASNIPGLHHAKIHPDQKDLKWDDWAMMIRYYYAFTTMIDAQIGRMIEHLKNTGLMKNTVIIFSSDHGQTLGSHGGLVDKGWHHFEETHRIPLIMRFPEAQHKGLVIEELASLVDIYPTILDIANFAHDCPGNHGKSLLPLLEKNKKWNRGCVVTEFNGLSNSLTTQRTLRRGNWKYGYNNCGDCELYNLEKDPYEMHNLINDQDCKEKVMELEKCLADWMKETNDPTLRRFIFSHGEKMGLKVDPT
jgi:arylsulfatase A-like enzyme